MTDDDLARLEALAGAATPGPWKATSLAGDSDPDVDPALTAGRRYWYVDAPRWGVCQIPAWFRTAHEPNAEFIAAARSAVPALVAEVRRLRAMLTRESQ